jgi:hypothetical protein
MGGRGILFFERGAGWALLGDLRLQVWGLG